MLSLKEQSHGAQREGNGRWVTPRSWAVFSSPPTRKNRSEWGLFFFPKIITFVLYHLISLPFFHASEVSLTFPHLGSHLLAPSAAMPRSPPSLSVPMRHSRNLRWEGWSTAKGVWPPVNSFLKASASQLLGISGQIFPHLFTDAWTQNLWVGLLMPVNILCLSVGCWAPREHIHTPESILVLPWRQWGHCLTISPPGSAFSVSAAPTLTPWAGLEPFLPHLLSRLALLQPFWPVNSEYFL